MGEESSERPHVFVVNDARAFLDFMREMLREEGYDVTIASAVPQTFDQIAAAQPSAVVVDLVVGRAAGWDLLERLHAADATRQLPVVVSSTDPRLLERAKAEQERYGGERYVAKPFDLDEMLGAIRASIAETRGGVGV